ncbi:MAG: Bifunctional uridylyltransferase/uridylyl-removing enzyme, partial [Actinomycetota bacterium]
MLVDVTDPAVFRNARAELLASPWTPDLPPAQRRAALSDLTDGWLQGVFAASGAPPQGAALVAVGGYGRRELAPGSDIDLVLLHSPGTDVDEVADRVWYPVWDSGLRLDHSVRTPAQARRMANSDLKVMLGLLDARTVVGDASLLAGLRASALSDWRARAAERLSELRDLVEVRRHTFGELAYLQEPDVKDSLGGLRDVVIMRAIAASSVTDVPRGRLADPYNLLLDVRDALHTATGRGSDKLLRQEQPGIALMLGIDDPRGDGDGVLRAVSAAGRTIDWASDIV